MDKLEYYKALTFYKSSMKQAKTMLELGLISTEDYSKIDTKLAQKYGINSCSIFADNSLIYTEYDGNIPYTEVQNINENH